MPIISTCSRIISFRLVKRLSLLLSVTPLISACASTLSTQDSAQCVGNATYTAVLSSTWSAATHPENFPSNPHYSDLIGATHNQDASLWSLGKIASSGMRDVAERGDNLQLIKEIKWSIKTGDSGSLVHGVDIKTSPGTVAVDFELSDKYPLVSLVSMIAPSPDWFVGISGINMCESGNWILDKTIRLKAYDAGTDDGEAYESADKATTPKREISVVRKNNSDIPQMGTLRIKFKSIN